MTELIQLVTDANVTAFKKISSSFTNHLLVNTRLIAGIKVRNKIGGPVMLVHGFKISNSRQDYSKINKDSEVQGYYLNNFPRVELNVNNLTLKEIRKSSNCIDKVPVFLFYKDLFTDEVSDSDDQIIVICKYWSDYENKFLYQLEGIHELEIVCE